MRVARLVLRLTLALLLFFVGLGGLYGGWLLISNPTGAALGVDAALLEGSPFPDYLFPGIVLFTVNGLASCAAGLAALAGWRFAGHAGALLGLFLVAWILIQIAIIGYASDPPFQTIFGTIGLVEIMLGSGLALVERGLSSRSEPVQSDASD